MNKNYSDQDIERILKQTTEDIAPSPLVLQKIMEEIKLDVTNPASPRYLLVEENNAGRFPSPKQFSINFITTMQKLKYIVPAVVVVIIVVAIGYSQLGRNTAPTSTQTQSSEPVVSENTSGSGSQPTPVQGNSQVATNNTAATPATGNVDDIANELNADATQQASIQSEGDAGDQQALSSISQDIANVNGASNVQ